MPAPPAPDLLGAALPEVDLPAADLPAVDPTGADLPGPGPSAAGSVAGSLSPSRAADFMACPLLYRFRVLDRLPERPSPAAARGTLVHAVLERLFDLPAAARTPERAKALLGPEWDRLLAEDPGLSAVLDQPAAGAHVMGEDGAHLRSGRDGEQAAATAGWLAGAHQLLDRYFELEDPRRLEPARRELYVETTLEAGLVLRGYVDRLDVAPTGEVRVVDYKTGRAPSEAFEAKALFQMRFYALVLWRLHGRVPRQLQLLYLGSGEVLRHAPDEDDLRATERKLLALWSAITRATQTGDWRPSPSRLCSWCDHRPLCPAFGGTPPPLPAGDAPAPGQ